MYKLEDLSYIMMSEVIAAIVLAHNVIYKDNIIYYFFAHNDLNMYINKGRFPIQKNFFN